MAFGVYGSGKSPVKRRGASRALAIALAAGVVLGAQVAPVAAQAQGLSDSPQLNLSKLSDLTARESGRDYANSEVVTGIGEGLVDIMGGKDGNITPAFKPAPGQLRNEFGVVGTHPVAATREALPCDGLVYTVYNRIVKDLHGVSEPTTCYDVPPESLNAPIVGAQLVYPADIASMDSAPLIVLSPGIGTEPGFYDKQARLYASHGYVVAIGYNFTNWFAPQMVLAAAVAAAANDDDSSALAGKIDFSRTMLVGHSAGGGSALFLNNNMDEAFRAAGIDMTTRGLVAINPGPSDAGLFSTPSEIPSLVAIAEYEDIVPAGMDHIGYDRATGPAWEAVVTGSYHGTYLDNPHNNVLASLVLSFGEYLLQGTARSKVVYEGDNYTLATDAELKDVQRKGI